MTRLSSAQLSRLFLGIGLLFVAVCYVGSLGNGAVWDDNPLIFDNPNLRSLRGALELVTHDLWTASDQGERSDFYRPAATLSFFVNRALIGSPLGLHLGNLLLHLGVFAVLYALLRRLLKTGAAGSMVGSLGFAVSAVNSEAVYWISGRFDLLATLAAILCVLGNEAQGLAGGLAVLGALGMGLLSKESQIILPVIIVLQDFLIFRRSIRQVWPKYLGILVLTSCYFGLRSMVGVITLQSASAVPISELIRSYAFSAWTIIRLAALPTDLNAFHTYLPPALWVAVLGLLALLAIGLALVFAIRRFPDNLSFRVGLWGWLWFLISLVPVATTGPNLRMLGDRYAYMPLVGLSILVAPLVDWAISALGGLPHGKLLRTAAAALVGVGWLGQGWVTAGRAKDWKSDKSLFEACVREEPGNPYGIYGIGTMILADGDYPGAEGYFLSSARIDPTAWRTQNALCVTWLNLGKLEDAQKACEISASVHPKNPRVWVNMASISVRKGAWREGLAFANNAIEVKPRYAEAHYLRAVCLGNLGRIADAKQALETALSLDPRHKGANGLKGQFVERGLWP